MESKGKLLTYITDVVEDIDLKIYERTQEGKTVFDCYMIKLGNDYIQKITIEEKEAAILFEGFNQIFKEDDTEYQTDEDYKSASDILNEFFGTLKQCDIEHFGDED
jgi:hypothetical protein